MLVVHTGRPDPGRMSLFFLMAVSMTACGQTPSARAFAPNPNTVATSSSSKVRGDDAARNELDNCRVHRVTGLPGSHQFASDFIETVATDPSGPAFRRDMGSQGGLEHKSSVSTTSDVYIEVERRWR